MLKPRLYQQTIFATAINHNTLVVIPTGLGKTLIAKMLAKHRVDNITNSKILILAPTKPLVMQHMKSFNDVFDETEMFLSVGTITPKKREENYKANKIIFATPQTIENDIINKRIKLDEVSLVVFDEAHKASGEYAYTFIAKQYEMQGKQKKILALTASPGTDKESIKNVCDNLYIEKIEVKKKEDDDVKQHVEETKVKYVDVELPKVFKEIKESLKASLDQRITSLQLLGYLKEKNTNVLSKRDYLGLQASCVKDISSGSASSETYSAMSYCAQLIKISHAIELLDTQGITALNTYFDKVFSDAKTKKSKALTSLVCDPNFKTARYNTINAKEDKIEHPKLDELKKIVENKISKNKNMKIIIFNQYRDSITKIVEEINKIENVKAKAFVGQAKKNNIGMSQKEQKQTIEDFSNGEFNVIVMTSVGEEGLDIPSVELVIFYEPVPSGIRTIQRRGRTGRHSVGNIITLVAKGTIDVAYRWSAHHKEKNMYKVLDKLTEEVQKEIDVKKNKKLTDFVGKKDVKIMCDQRENGSIIRELSNLGIDCEVKNIECDFYLSSNCGVERKKVKDFVDSIVDGRLLIQIKNLANNLQKPLLIIEGEEDLFSVRAIHPNAIRAMLSTIAISYRVPIIYTKTEYETAQMLYTIAKREQTENNKDFNMHFTKQQMSLDEELVYIVSAIPTIGPATAKTLLKEFGSIKGIFSATLNQLTAIKGVGENLAKHIKEILNRKYIK